MNFSKSPSIDSMCTLASSRASPLKLGGFATSVWASSSLFMCMLRKHTQFLTSHWLRPQIASCNDYHMYPRLWLRPRYSGASFAPSALASPMISPSKLGCFAPSFLFSPTKFRSLLISLIIFHYIGFDIPAKILHLQRVVSEQHHKWNAGLRF